MALPNDKVLQNTFKEEIQNILNDFNHEHDMAIDIKTENDTLRAEVPVDDAHNPFQNVQVQVKQEVNFSLILENEDSNSQNRENLETNVDLVTESGDSNLNNANKEVEIKKEGQTDESLVSYDFPNFDDAESMDSNEAAALRNVEACLQDEINIKSENNCHYDEIHRDGFNSVVKIEADLTLTDTHLIPNNITSTVVKAVCGNIEGPSKPKPALVVIHSLPHKSKSGNEEEILPTSYANDNNIDMKPFRLNSLRCDDYEETYSDDNIDNNTELFQLNSITGNVLSLEQEAYGLLRAKKKIQNTNKSYPCKECPKVYSSNHSLKKHWEVHRTIERRLAGVIQGQKTRKKNLKKKPLPEQSVNPVPKQNDTELYQLNSITGNVLSLEQQAYGLSTQDTKNKPHKCTECPKSYSTKRSLRVHQEVHRTIERRLAGLIQSQKTRKQNIKNLRKKKPAPEKRDKDKQYPTNNVKINHNQVKKEGYDCTCGKVFQRRSRMETCLRSHNLFETNSNCVPCMTCTKKFKNKVELALHRKRLHRKKFPCKFCPTDYDTRKELFKHLQIHQTVQLMEYKVISEVMKGKQKLRCFMCSKSWSELSELKNHVMNDHREPYICPHCKNTFPKIIDFGNHTKTYHPEVEGQSVLDVLEAFSRLVQAWKCEECELQFLEADKLALHQIEKHSPDLKAEPQFQCTDCRRVFISQKGLTSHRRVHHSTETTEETKVEETGIMCLECRKICKDMTALTSHMRLHSPERKYPCKFCDFRFATPEKRKAHAEVHTGDMKYVCFICEYQCSSENRLKHHKTSLKHANIKEYLLTGKPLLEEPQTSSKQEKIKETLRKNEWSVKRRKKDKEDKKKEDNDAKSETEVACDICGDKFSSESEMLEHKQTHPFIEFPNDDKPSRIFFK